MTSPPPASFWQELGPGVPRGEMMNVARLFQLAQIARFCPSAARRSYLCA